MERCQALWVYGADHRFRLSDGFELRSRTVGEDMPGNAMTMVGCAARVPQLDPPAWVGAAD